MTRKKTAGRGPAKTPAKSKRPVTPKTPAKEPAKTPEPAQGQLATLVEPLAPQALKLVLSIIDNATMKGSEAQLVLGLKVELGRVAGAQSGRQ